MSQIRIACVAVVLAGALASPAPAATRAEKCATAKNKIARKYHQCRATAEAKGILDSMPPDYTKCAAAFLKTWGKAEEKFGAACLDGANLASMQELIDQQTDQVAAIIADTEGIPFCGDGLVNDPSEQCDGADLDGVTCEALGKSGGALACTNCALDTRGCVNVTFPATGVTTSYVANDDGAVRAGGVLAYTNNADGTITDHRTGLMWSTQVGLDGEQNPATLLDADNCYSWWGVCMGAPNPVDTSCTVDSECGAEGPCWRGLSHPCQNESPGFTAFQVVDYLNQVEFAGYDDWRLPNVKELASLVDYSRIHPAIDPAFHGASCGTDCVDASPACACTVWGPYWTSTTHHRTVSDGAWAGLFVEFFDGLVWSAQKYGVGYVRAVRGGA